MTWGSAIGSKGDVTAPLVEATITHSKRSTSGRSEHTAEGHTSHKQRVRERFLEEVTSSPRSEAEARVSRVNRERGEKCGERSEASSKNQTKFGMNVR